MNLITIEKHIENENYWPESDSRIAVCMSGGVDSSVSAYLTKKKGYDTVGLTGWLIKGGGRCCDSGMVDAAKLSEFIGIEHVSKDLRIFFKQEIVDPFIHSYSEGITPIPCITCNNVIKWGTLMNYAFSELEATHIATGHYAKLIFKKAGDICPITNEILQEDLYLIKRPKDKIKDQTFMLWGLGQEVLSKTVFPLGELTKEEVRKVAENADLFLFNKKESQDICFVSAEEGTQGFLAKYLEKKEGLIIENKTGNVLGTHSGTQNFTIGQRKGIGIAHSEPLYVIRLDVDNNLVFVGSKDELEGNELIAEKVNWIFPIENLKSKKVMAKIRYNSQTAPASVSLLDDNKIKVTFDLPQSAITPGQSVVIYDSSDEYLLGGGWIS